MLRLYCNIIIYLQEVPSTPEKGAAYSDKLFCSRLPLPLDHRWRSPPYNWKELGTRAARPRDVPEARREKGCDWGAWRDNQDVRHILLCVGGSFQAGGCSQSCRHLLEPQQVCSPVSHGGRAPRGRRAPTSHKIRQRWVSALELFSILVAIIVNPHRFWSHLKL